MNLVIVNKGRIKKKNGIFHPRSDPRQPGHPRRVSWKKKLKSSVFTTIYGHATKRHPVKKGTLQKGTLQKGTLQKGTLQKGTPLIERHPHQICF